MCTDINENIRIANEFIYKPITEEEIRKAISNLKNNKANGQDNVKTEHMKYTSELMLPTYGLSVLIAVSHVSDW